MKSDTRNPGEEIPPAGYAFIREYDIDDPSLANAIATLTGGLWPYYTGPVYAADGKTEIKGRVRLHYKNSVDNV